MILKFSNSDLVQSDELIGSQASESDYNQIIESDADIYLDNELVATYRVVSGHALNVAAALATKSKLTRGKRTNGLRVKNAIYGYMARNPTRCNYCRPTSASINNPKMNKIATMYANYIDGIYQDSNYAQWQRDKQEISTRVLPEWRIGETMWSSLNVNVNFAIRYHRDTANWPGTFSNVFIYRSGCAGGDLVLPELSIALKQQKGACIFFHGGELIHGVTPIRETRRDWVRASIVLYTMREMAHCRTHEEEAAAHELRSDEISREKRLGNPKLRARYAKKIERLSRDRDNARHQTTPAN